MHVGGPQPVSSKYSKKNIHQASLLEQAFAACSYTNKSTLTELSLQTGLHKWQISGWFCKKRQNARGEKSCEY